MKKLRMLADKKGITLSTIGFGCWAIGGAFFLDGKYDGWGDIDDAESIRAIQKGYDLGVNFFDTADVYGTGHSERVLGKAVKRFRDDVVIATKFGFQYDEKTKRVEGISAEPEYIEKALKASLKRLKTHYIDVYQLHVGAIEQEKIEPMIDKLEQLVKKGYILGYGWSTNDETMAAKITSGENAVALQHSMNLFGGNEAILKLAEADELASLNNSPLAMGLLSGKYKADSQISGQDVRSAGHAWVEYFENGIPKPAFLDRLEKVREILTADGRSLVQGALSYLHAVSDNNLPIPGFKNVRQATENASVLNAIPLSVKQADEIKNILGEK